MLLGHEAAGRVVGLGDGVAELAIGQRRPRISASGAAVHHHLGVAALATHAVVDVRSRYRHLTWSPGAVA